MKKIDQSTLNFYNSYAAEIAERYNSVESALHSLLPVLFQPGQKVLDAGCGSGRDLKLMRHMGLEAYGLEPSDALRAQAVEVIPELKGLIFNGGLPDIPENLPGPFDGVILSAVIMHIPDRLLFETAFAIKGLLKTGGVLIISHCTRRDIPAEDQDDDGRLFVLRSSERIHLLFEELGFEKRHLFSRNDGLGRDWVEWEILVLEKKG